MGLLHLSHDVLDLFREVEGEDCFDLDNVVHILEIALVVIEDGGERGLLNILQAKLPIKQKVHSGHLKGWVSTGAWRLYFNT